MGRWQISVSSEMFHRHHQRKRSSAIASTPTEILDDAEEQQLEEASSYNHHRQEHDEKRSGISTLTTSALGVTSRIIGEDRQKGEEEEWNCNHPHFQSQHGEKKRRSNLRTTAHGVRSEITGEEQQREENYTSYYYQVQGENRSSSVTTTSIGEMCNGGGGDVTPVAVAAPAEEWSPIRETPLPLPLSLLPRHHQAFDRFPAEEPGASSDMDTEEDAVPLVRRPREEAAAAAVALAAADDIARASAVRSNIESGAVAGSVVPLDRSGGASFLTTTAAEPAAKRERLPELGQNPVVQVTYEGLTRESKNVLQRALQSWSYWHSRNYTAGMEGTDEVLQTGTEVYSPALALEPASTTGTISVWIDKPLKKQKATIQNCQDKERDVPLYDRACISALPSQDSENPDGFVCMEPEEDSRCFNCGSYSHALRSCPRPHSVAAIRNARDTLSNKRGPRPRTASRYYQCSPGGKFDDLKPGVLSLEARKAIGVGEVDPPPWLNRMREIGYPPGYLEDTEDERSGVQIIDDDTQAVTRKESSKDGNVLENLIPLEEKKIGQKMTVEYPGINAPIPEKADERMWAAPPETPPVESRGCKRPYRQISQMHNSGSSLLSPHSPWAGGMGDTDLRHESYGRSVSSGHAEWYSRNKSDGMESQIDVYGSNLYRPTSPVVNMNGNLSVDPAIHWSERRVSGTSSLAIEGTNHYDVRPPGTQTYHHHIPSNPSGLASPIRDMFRTPGAAEPMSSTSRRYSRHNYYHSQTQGAPLPNGQGQSETANQAWLKAQSALDALQPSRTSGGLLGSPHRVPTGPLQNSRGPGVPHQWGRR